MWYTFGMVTIKKSVLVLDFRVYYQCYDRDISISAVRFILEFLEFTTRFTINDMI